MFPRVSDVATRAITDAETARQRYGAGWVVTDLPAGTVERSLPIRVERLPDRVLS